MSLRRTVVCFAAGWICLVTVLHGWLNLNIRLFGNEGKQLADTRLRIGFIPVT